MPGDSSECFRDTLKDHTSPLQGKMMPLSAVHFNHQGALGKRAMLPNSENVRVDFRRRDGATSVEVCHTEKFVD
jgi:hypothetical protein